MANLGQSSPPDPSQPKASALSFRLKPPCLCARQACWTLASDSTEGIERVEVTRLQAGTEHESVVWRGAATLPSLETGRGLWITRAEWAQRGALAAREACAFSW